MKTFALTLAVLFFGGSIFSQEEKKEEKPLTREEAQKMMQKEIESFGWTRSGKGRLGAEAQIEIPKGYRFTGKSGTKKMLEFTGNISGDNELGVIAPESLDWWVLFEFDDVGYVKDSDKDKLDADAILKQLREGQEAANAARAKQGLRKLFLDGWAMPPRYNEQTHNLEWAIKVRNEEGGTSINYLTKLLGRRGVMHVTLLVSAEELQATLPEYRKLIDQFSYLSGQTYAEYRQGDKIAQYTLAGLITAGAGAALLKSGWLAKLGVIFAKGAKGIVVGIVVLFGFLKKMFLRLFGRKSSEA